MIYRTDELTLEAFLVVPAFGFDSEVGDIAFFRVHLIENPAHITEKIIKSIFLIFFSKLFLVIENKILFKVAHQSGLSHALRRCLWYFFRFNMTHL